MIKSFFIISILCICFVTSSSAQDDMAIIEDTTIYLDELVFNSSYEEEIFREVYHDRSNDYLSLIYLVKKGVDQAGIEKAKFKLAKKVSSFKARRIKSKGEKKSIKIIYKEVHNEFLKKYELTNHVDDVFSRGYYNCLSASFLYGLILEELGIPYQVNILPSHVNLTAYPESEKIIIETTDPLKGYFVYDKKFKELYVSNLISYKLIEQSEAETTSVDQLFEKYYDSNQSLSLKELIGAQYYNDGLYLIETGNNIEAIEQLEKAIALYPSIVSANMLILLYSDELRDTDYSNKKHIEYLMKLLRYDKLGVDPNNIIYEINRVEEKYLTEKKDTVFFKKFYKILNSNLKNDSLKIELNKFYLASLGNYHFNNLRYDMALKYFLKTIELGNVEARIENIYIRSLILFVEDFSDKQKSLSYLNSSENDYPKVKNNRLYMSYKAEILTLLLARNFERNKSKEAEINRFELESILDNEDVKINENNLGIAYATAGSYYFRKGNRSKARLMFKKGLAYSPGNYELETRLKMLNY